MTPDDTRERLARIKAGQYWDRALAGPLGHTSMTRQHFVDSQWPEFCGEVDAILRAMLEPSEGMVAAFKSGVNHESWFCEYEGEWHRSWNPTNGIRAMIQHIIDEKPDA